jgi:hypothetical protein
MNMGATLESDKTPPVPSLTEIEVKFVELIQGHCSRQEAADWASRWVGLADPPDMDATISEALDALSGADMPTTNRPYLYNESDFRHWLKELHKHT